MAGYSGTPLPKKLGVKPGSTIALIDAPSGFEATLGLLPDGAALRRGLRGKAPVDVILLFVTSARGLTAGLARAEPRLATNGGLWVCWPKKSSGMPTEIGEGDVRERGLATGLVDNKVCAVDSTWSGLRFVRRLADR